MRKLNEGSEQDGYLNIRLCLKKELRFLHKTLSRYFSEEQEEGGGMVGGGSGIHKIFQCFTSPPFLPFFPSFPFLHILPVPMCFRVCVKICSGIGTGGGGTLSCNFYLVNGQRL